MHAHISPADAEEAVLAAVSSLGLVARPAAAKGDDRPDLALELPGGPTITLQVKTMSLVDAAAAHRLPNRTAHVATTSLLVVVAPRITSAARDVLNEAGVSWLDLRGHFRLVGAGVFVDTAVAPVSDPAPVRRGVLGQVGVELAALLLMEPGRVWGVRAAGVALSRAPSSVSQAFAALRSSQLVNDTLRPEAPELFWELAQHWNSPRADVASLPGPGRGRDSGVLRLGLDEVETTTGWALTDTVAAAHYGAPVAIRVDHPVDLYVPDRSALRRALHLLGPAASASVRAGQIRVAPVPAVCQRRVDGSSWAGTEWPLAHPLFVALDLAQDPGRGREILRDWTPTGQAQRVW